MGIRRTVEWKLLCTPEEADRRIRGAMEEMGIQGEGPLGQIHASAKRSMRKNRWASEIDVTLTPSDSGSVAVCEVDMAGTSHFALLSEISEAVGDEVFDDQGTNAAVERLGKAGRFFGRKEVRHLRNILHASEIVLELGSGQCDKKQGLIVLTDERLFFFEKSLGSETQEEFNIGSVASMSNKKKMGGETLTVNASGNNAEIKNMMHGQADAITRAFRSLKQRESAPTPPSNTAADDPLAQLERLADMRDKGIVSDAEFEAKKAELIARL